MSLIERGLAKLTINAYKDREGKIQAGTIQAMYNPDSLQLDYQTDYQQSLAINSEKQSSIYVQAKPAGLSLELIFDGTMPDNKIPVEAQLMQLKQLCSVDATSYETQFLQIKWGKMRWENRGYFAGRAKSLSVNYTLFDRDATPLRARVILTLVADESLVLQETEQNLKSPAQIALRVQDGVSLAMMAASTASMLSGGVDYLTLASQNNLDNLNGFAPGEILQATRGNP
ncbi:CIS tube protein [Xenorhabdus stockiae]|uniref:CIS tube protein n=1 Tax=Xenorhabdus stockiae TaxID=351614 RepID=UPI00406390EE